MPLDEINTREFDLGDILGGGWELTKKNIKTILALTFVLYSPVWIFCAIEPKLESLLGGLASLMGTIAVAYMVEQTVNNDKAEWTGLLAKAYSRWWVAILTSVLAVLIILGLTLLLIVPGIIWAGYYTFVIYAVGLRGQKVSDALLYSKSLVKGRWWKVFGTCLVLALAVFVPATVLTVPFAFLPDGPASDVPMSIILDIAGSVFIVFETVFFLNLDYLHNAPKPEPVPVNPLDLVPTFGKKPDAAQA